MASDAPIIELADAVVALLNATPCSQAFEARRAYLPEFDLARLSKTNVLVMAGGDEQTRAAQTRTADDLVIHVGVQKHVAPDRLIEIDPLMVLVHELKQSLRFTTLAGATWESTKNNPPYVPEFLAKLQIFTSILVVTYKYFSR